MFLICLYCAVSVLVGRGAGPEEHRPAHEAHAVQQQGRGDQALEIVIKTFILQLVTRLT